MEQTESQSNLIQITKSQPTPSEAYRALIVLLRPVAKRAQELGLSEQDFMDAAKQAY